MKKFLLKSFLIFLISTTVFSCWAAAKELDPDILKRSAGVVREKFPDADNVLLSERERYVCHESGTYTAKDEFYAKILTENGRNALRRLSFYFNEHYNRIKVEQITVIKPDGRKENIDIAANSRVVIDSSQMASNIYDPASKRLVISLPRVEVGDVLYFRTSDEHFKPRIPGFWSNYSLLQSDWPIIENVIEVDMPEKMPLRSIALKDEVKGSVVFSQKRESGRIIYKWHASDVPQVIREPGMPELHTCVQRLLVSTAGSWKDVSKWYWNLCRPRLDAVTPAMRQKTAELIKGKKDDMAKIRAIFQFVSQQIRYMGITPEKEAPGYEPHDVKLTFEQKYGVCRDKAALLVSMLELAGFKAFPVLFMSGDPKDDEIPNGYFNHAVTAVELGKGNYVLMDPTYESTTDLFPAFQADMSYLVAHPEGEILRRSPVVPAEKNLAKIRSSARIDAEGIMHCKSLIELYGVNDLYYRGALSRWPAERKEEFFTGRLRRILPGVELKKLEITPENIRDMSIPLKFKLHFSVPQRRFAAEWLVMVPELSRGFGISEAVFQDIGLLKRKYPLKFFTTCFSDEEFSVTLPENCRVLALPESARFGVGKKIEWNRNSFLSGNVLKAKNLFSLNVLELKSSEYPELKAALNRMKNSCAVLPVAEDDFRLSGTEKNLQAFAGADSVIDKYATHIKLQDSSNWSVTTSLKRLILNYAGVKAHSEIKIPFVPVWESVSLQAKVTGPDGKIREIGKNELNVMDSPGNAGGPRYPAGKILVASLPNVVPGSVIEVEMKRVFRNRNFFSMHIPFFTSTAPVVSRSLTVDAPDDMHIRNSINGTRINYNEYNEGDRRIRTWSASDIPRLKNETGMAPWQMHAAGVLLSSGDNKSYAAKLNKVLNEKVEASVKDIRALVKEQKWENCKDKAQVVKQIRDHVDKFIRKSDVPLKDIPFEALSNAGVTLSSGYGNSADQAILIGAILKFLKINFRFTGVSGIGYTAGSAGIFNRAPDPERMCNEILVYVPDLQWYLNDTSRYAAPGTVNNEGKLGIDLGTGRLINIQSSGMYNSGRFLNFYIECRADTSAVVRVTEELYGREYEKVRKFIETATPERLRRFFEEKGSTVSHGSSLEGPGEYDMKNYPGILRYKLKITDALQSFGPYCIMLLPCYDAFAKVISSPVARKRESPYWRNEQQKLNINYTVVPPPGYEAVSGRKARAEYGQYGSFRFSENYSASPSRILLRSKLFVPVEFVTVSGCRDIESLQNELMRPAADRIVFKPIGTEKKKR